MASYIPGVTDYIPQAQPFTPDYNFLGNMLQNAQTKYDANYKTLSKTYGTLLNSPMLREDNIQQRDEFFKMIDNDIKRISGLDLSLQQNVDAANMVFESFYNNKEMVKDMAFTKEYQRQLQIGDNYRNCLSQDQCGGKYWDVGMNALNYKADEFKKANRQDTLTMSPGRYVPMINVQEKAMKYATDLLGKDGAFGIQTMTKSPDGRYNITLKNGQLLQVPLQQLLLNQYGKDQDIIDMYQTSAYVNRKNFIASNVERFGSEDAAEDEYFRMADLEVNNAIQAHQDALDLKNATNLKKQGIERQIRTQGSTGDDDIAFDYETAGVDDAAASESVDYHKQSVQVANSIFDAGDNRTMKRQRVDALFARTSMSKEISQSAVAVADLTGQMSYEADPYAKSYYDFSLEMSKMKKQYELMGEHEILKASIELSKEQALTEYQKRGDPMGTGNVPTWFEDYLGTSSGEMTDDERAEIQNYIVEHTKGSQSASQKYVAGYANVLAGVLMDPNASALDKDAANAALKGVFGTAKYNDDGSVKTVGWDPKKRQFIGPNGKGYTDPQQIVDYIPDWRGLYDKAQHWNKQFKSYDAQGNYLKGEGKQYMDQYNLENKQVQASSNLWMQNNLNVKNYALTGGYFEEGIERQNWENFFTPEGKIKTKEQFTKDFIESERSSFKKYSGKDLPVTAGYIGFSPSQYGYNEQGAAAKANELYEKYNEVYGKVYNGGHTTNGKPVVEALIGTTDFAMLGGGKTSGAAIFTYNSNTPAEMGTRGLITFFRDAMGPESMFTIGNYATEYEAQVVSKKHGADAKQAYQQLVSDIISGNLTKEEMAAVGNIAYMDVALSNPDYAGVHVHFPQSWVDRYKSSDEDATGWANNEEILKNGVGAYIKKDGAKNDFTMAYKTQPYDLILNHQSETISYGNAGSITINKKAPDGSFTVTGYMYGYDNGVKVPVEVTKLYESGTSGQNIYVGLNTWMAEVDRVNKQHLQDPNATLYFNPNTLPNIQKGLNQQAGDAQQYDLNTYFRQQLQLNTQQMQQLNM
ncbi:MAG: hypothetical protein E6Q36_08190 [Chryseobacterium sp.]|nr:MAG: hypothetical protein E6Q36_08190 [Chryseobacterium sp.]